MIEVTLGMVYSILEWAENDNAGRSELNSAIRRIIELHEANKPKPEPLSEEQIHALHIEVSKDHGVSRWLCHLIVRLTEQAHGIGATND